MLDIEQMKKETTSKTWKGRITNPVRHMLVWPFVRPFFEAAHKQAASSCELRLVRENDVLGQELIALRGENDIINKDLVALRRENNVINKDLIALRYRLASIESALIDAREAMAEQRKFAASLLETAVRANALDNGVPLRRIDGLVVVPQDYGCFLIHRQDVLGDAVVGGMSCDEHLRSVIESCANRDGIAVDAGACIGFHSVFMSRLFKTVHSFEPQRHIYHILRANLALNGCDNVLAHNQALYDHACHLHIGADYKQEIPITRKDTRIDDDIISNAAALTLEIADGDWPDTVPAVTIDCLDLRNVAFIKIDAQGADFRILGGARHTIERWRPVVAFKLEGTPSNQHHTQSNDVTQFFASLDYSQELARSYGEGKQMDYIARPRTA
jgi:FkbM family methyltransferase